MFSLLSASLDLKVPTMTKILFVFPFTFKFGNPSEV